MAAFSDGSTSVIVPGKGRNSAGISTPLGRCARRGPAKAPETWTTLELLEFLAGRAISPQRAIEVELAGGNGGNWIARHGRATAKELGAQLDLPENAALRLACALELGRRATQSHPGERAMLRTPRDAFEWVWPTLQGRDRECVVALYLDGRHRLIQLHEVSVGTANAALIHPREVFGPALRLRACAVVVAHNHPSGDPEPSAEDRGVTARLHEAGELVGVPLIDHLVIGGGEFVSLRGRGAWISPQLERARRA